MCDQEQREALLEAVDDLKIALREYRVAETPHIATRVEMAERKYMELLPVIGAAAAFEFHAR